MKYIVIALAGAADHPCEDLGGKTPLDVAKLPNLNTFAKMGKVGQVKLLSDRLEPAADVSLMNLLGYQADKEYTGRGPLEAANLELQLEENEIPFRMNFITESQGRLMDPTAGMLSTKEAKVLLGHLNKKVSSGFVRFFPGSDFRHIAVIKDSHGWEALSARTASPEEMTGENLEGHLPKGPGDALLKKLMYDARLLLQDHEVNQVRVDLQENPANMIWLWGQGPRPKLARFSERYGMSGALISGMEYAKGLARIAGLTVLETDSGLMEEEEDLHQISKLMLDALRGFDFVCVHLNGCDEASRRGDLRGKITAMEAADYFLLPRVKEYLEAHKDVRVLVTPCHAARWAKKRHVRGMVPFLAAGQNIPADDIETFSELAAKASELKVTKSAEFLPKFLIH